MIWDLVCSSCWTGIMPQLLHVRTGITPKVLAAVEVKELPTTATGECIFTRFYLKHLQVLYSEFGLEIFSIFKLHVRCCRDKGLVISMAHVMGIGKTLIKHGKVLEAALVGC